MGQAETTAVATQQSPITRSPINHPPQPSAAPPAPRRGVRISRSRSEPRPGPTLDALILEVVMGWEWRLVEPADAPAVRLLWNPKWGTPHCNGDVRPVDDLGADAANNSANGANDGSAPITSAIPWDAPRPSTDPAAASEMEAEIEHRGLQYPYTVALTSIVAHTKSSQQGWENGWCLMRATPAQRCHAALRAAGYGPRC
jgi:hypothetical protein